jgi:hypothetical protein
MLFWGHYPVTGLHTITACSKEHFMNIYQLVFMIQMTETETDRWTKQYSLLINSVPKKEHGSTQICRCIISHCNKFHASLCQHATVKKWYHLTGHHISLLHHTPASAIGQHGQVLHQNSRETPMKSRRIAPEGLGCKIIYLPPCLQGIYSWHYGSDPG